MKRLLAFCSQTVRWLVKSAAQGVVGGSAFMGALWCVAHVRDLVPPSTKVVDSSSKQPNRTYDKTSNKQPQNEDAYSYNGQLVVNEKDSRIQDGYYMTATIQDGYFGSADIYPRNR